MLSNQIQEDFMREVRNSGILWPVTADTRTPFYRLITRLIILVVIATLPPISMCVFSTQSVTTIKSTTAIRLTRKPHVKYYHTILNIYGPFKSRVDGAVFSHNYNFKTTNSKGFRFYCVSYPDHYFNRYDGVREFDLVTYILDNDYNTRITFNCERLENQDVDILTNYIDKLSVNNNDSNLFKYDCTKGCNLLLGMGEGLDYNYQVIVGE
jgi:hypothetical protein